MENAVEAMKIAFGMLIFVLALSISISGFSQARIAVDTIASIREEEETFVKDGNGNYLNYLNFEASDEGGIRTVGVDTVISSMYRAIDENFKICFYVNGDELGEFGLASKNDANGDKYYYIDISNETKLEGNTITTKKNLEQVFSDPDVYEYLSEIKFIEKLGEYYQEDDKGAYEESEVYKTKKRVIIYEQI